MDACPDIQFTLEAVGEGLFYDGRIKSFNFVYDCGSQKQRAVDAAVDRYHKRIGTSALDLLIISHLHSDHVDGLDRLLNLMKVKYIVMPYVRPIERLLIWAATTKRKRWFRTFLTRPYSYLLRDRGIERIVVVTGGRRRSEERQGGESDNPNDYDKKPPTNIEGNWPGEFAIDDESFESMPEDREIQSRMEVVGDLPADLRGRVMVRQHFGYLNIRGNWMFRFFNKPISAEKINGFVNCLKSNVKPLGGDLTVDQLSDLLRNPAERKRFADCYKRISSDLNFTSLVALHSSLGWNAGGYIEVEGRRTVIGSPKLEWMMLSSPSQRIGHLLLGDINLGGESWNELRQHFDKYLSDIDAILIPHHGSRRSWNRALLGEIPAGCRLYLSAGIGNQYSHPSITVISETEQSGRLIRWSDDFHEFSVCYY